MGVSTNAILALGFDLGEELPAKIMATVDEDDCFDEYIFIAKANGTTYGDVEYDEFQKMRAEFPISIETHCSSDYPMYFLAIRGTVQSARRGVPTAVQTSEPSGHQLAAMRKFCEEWGIEWQEPKWHIFSYWG